MSSGDLKINVDLDLLIRREKPEDFSEIYNLVKVAFQTAMV